MATTPITPIQPKGIVVDLGAEVTLKSFPAMDMKASSIEILKYEDDPIKKTVKAFTKGITGIITLWEGAAYDAIGQWTDADVIARLKQLYHK